MKKAFTIILLFISSFGFSQKTDDVLTFGDGENPDSARVIRNDWETDYRKVGGVPPTSWIGRRAYSALFSPLLPIEIGSRLPDSGVFEFHISQERDSLFFIGLSFNGPRQYFVGMVDPEDEGSLLPVVLKWRDAQAKKEHANSYISIDGCYECKRYKFCIDTKW